MIQQILIKTELILTRTDLIVTLVVTQIDTDQLVRIVLGQLPKCPEFVNVSLISNQLVT